jgi:hypothetical protein
MRAPSGAAGTADLPRGTCIEGYAGEWCQTCGKGWFAFEIECIRCPGNPGTPGCTAARTHSSKSYVRRLKPEYPDSELFTRAGIRIFIFILLMLIFVGLCVWASTKVREDKGSTINLFKGMITPMAIILSRGQILGALTNLDANWPKFVLQVSERFPWHAHTPSSLPGTQCVHVWRILQGGVCVAVGRVAGTAHGQR